MTIRMRARRAFAVAALAALLGLAGSPAARAGWVGGGPGDGPVVLTFEEFLAELWGWLTSATEGDEPPNGDQSASIDPNGSTDEDVPSQPISPNGSRAPRDQSASIDPNG